MPLVARCWKCNAPLLSVEREEALVIAYVTCVCGEPNAVSYSFPNARVELE